MEAQCVEELVLDYSQVNTAVLLQGEPLSASSAPNIRPAAAGRVDVEVVPISPSPPPQDAAAIVADKADAGFLSEGSEGLFNRFDLRGRVMICDDVGHVDFPVPSSGPCASSSPKHPPGSPCAAIGVSLLHVTVLRDCDVPVLNHTVLITIKVLVD